MITSEMIAMAVEADEFFINWLFSEIAGAFGYSAWYECEEAWNDIADALEEIGCPNDLVTEIFSEMANEL